MRHYRDEDLERLGRTRAVEAVRAYLMADGRGLTEAPPRFKVPIGSRQLVFTVGGNLAEDVAGFRFYSYDRTAETHERSQLLALVRIGDGELLATAQGSDFGAWRTAALGAVAMDVATRHLEYPLDVAVLGAGFQAFHHTRTWVATRPIQRMRIWARRYEAAVAFAKSLTASTGCPTEAIADADEAAVGAHAVLGVTASTEPVVTGEALQEARYIATVGPKFGGRNELPPEAYAAANVLVSDAPAQCARFEDERGPLPGGRSASELVSLGQVVAGLASLGESPERVLFVSEGLAGSEVSLLAALHRLSGGVDSGP